MSEIQMEKKQLNLGLILGLAAAFVCLFYFSYQLIDNTIDLGIVENRTRVDRFEYRGDVEVPVDSSGNVVENWEANNPTDDIIKGFFVVLTLACYSQLIAALLVKTKFTTRKRQLIAVGITLGSIPVFLFVTFLIAFSRY